MTTTTRRNQSTATTKALSEQIDSAILWITVAMGGREFSQTAVDRSKTIFDLYPAYPSILSIVANDMPFLGRDDLATEYNEIIDASK